MLKLGIYNKKNSYLEARTLPGTVRKLSIVNSVPIDNMQFSLAVKANPVARFIFQREGGQKEL